MVFQGVSEDHRGIKRCSRLFRGVLENTGYFQKMFQGFMGFRRRSRRSFKNQGSFQRRFMVSQSFSRGLRVYSLIYH